MAVETLDADAGAHESHRQREGRGGGLYMSQRSILPSSHLGLVGTQRVKECKTQGQWGWSRARERRGNAELAQEKVGQIHPLQFKCTPAQYHTHPPTLQQPYKSPNLFFS